MSTSDLAVLAQSSFQKGEVTPAADPLVQQTTAVTNVPGQADGGYIPDPNAGSGGSDGGVIAPPAPGGTVGGTTPTSPGTPSTPTAPSNPSTPSDPGTVAGNPPTTNPVTPPVDGSGNPPATPVTPPPSGDGGQVAGPTNPPTTPDGGLVTPPGDGGGNDGGSVPGTNPPGGGVVQNPPSDPGGNPSTPVDPTNPSNPSTPNDPGTNPPGGGVVQNPPIPGTPGDGGNLPGTGNPPGGNDGGTVPGTNPPGGGVVHNPPIDPGTPSDPTNPGTPGTPGNPTTPGNPPGGGVVQNPPTPGTPGDGGNIPGGGTPGGNDGGNVPCTNPLYCPVFKVTLNRVCSERRSAIQYPQFVFFEEAKRPLLTFEATVNLSQSQSASLASMGAGMPHPMESTLINVLLNPRQPRTRQVVLGGKSLTGVDLSHTKYQTSMTLALEQIKQWFPRSWNRMWINVSVCDDTNRDGLCYGEATPYQLLTQATGFRLGSIPRNVNLFVWSNRTSTLRQTPDMCEEQISPLVLDLTGNGFSFSSASSGVVFDLKDSGEPVLSAWTLSNEDAFLVRDLDGNGQIDTGAELFGSATRLESGERAANGFLALAELDSNGNGMFDPRDATWRSVQIWIDRHRNGTSEAPELYSLDRAGIDWIKVGYIDAKEVDAYGNETRQRSVYHRQVGGRGFTRQVIDIWFNTLNLD